MPEAPFGARRPHPVADVPPAALADGQAPAKGWLLALVAARPLRDAPALPMPDLARDGPVLCAAVLRAVGSDAALRRLESGGDLAGLAARAGELAGAGGPAAAAAAVAAMRGALWEALTATMAPLDAATTAAVAERLAFVCDAVAAAALSGGASPGGAAAPGAAGSASPGAAGSPGAAASPGAAGSASPGAAGSPGAPAPPAAGAAAALGAAAPPASAAPDDAVAAFRVHDARGDWQAAVERLAAGARPFALLALEVDDAPRLAAADAPGAAEAVGRVEQAVRDELRPGDVMGREAEGRLWVVAAELGASGARALAERLADAVAAVAPVRGAPLTVSIGLAASPAGGADRDELVARVDESLYAARAAGLPIA
jgi:GGDEF domain-containing protein